MSVAERREREQMMRREMILEAAKQLFEEKGYGPTTVDEIAAQAELGKGTIYSYFKSKEEIYIALLEKVLIGLKVRVDAALQKSESAVENLHALYDVFISYHNENKGFADTLLVQTDDQLFARLGHLADGLKAKFTEWVEFVAGVLQKGIVQGEFIAMDVKKVAKIIIGIIFGIIVENKMGQIDEDLFNYRESVFQLVLGGIRK